RDRDQPAHRSALREGAGRSRGAGLRSGGAEPVADPTRAPRDAAIGARRPRVPAMGARASRPRRRATASRHRVCRLGSRGAARGRARRSEPSAPARRGALIVRRAAAVLSVVLVGAPILIASSTAVVGLGALALLLCWLGILVATPVLVSGMVLALGEYALALWLSGAPPRLAGAALLGVVLLVLLETADLGRRAHRATPGPRGPAAPAPGGAPGGSSARSGAHASSAPP